MTMKKILFLLLIFTWLLALKCFAQPIQEVDPRSIWKDGSKTTTASIPFAQGIDISSAKKITFTGATNAYIAANLPGGGDLTMAANDASIANLNFVAANDIDMSAVGVMSMGGGGLTFTDNGGTSQFGAGNHTIPTTTTPAGIAFQSFGYIVFGDYGSGSGGVVFEDGVRIKPTVVNASRLVHTDSSGYLTGGTETISGTYNFASTNNYTGQNTFGTLAPIFSTTTANTLFYGNGSKAITSATVSSPLSFSAGTLSCPTCALTTDYIKKDGTTTTTGTIPFAVGARIENSQFLYFGTSATNSYIKADLTGGSEGILINATDATLSRFYATATNDMRFTTTTGPIYMSSAGGFFLQETVTGNTINVDSTGINALAIGSTADRLAYLDSGGYLVSGSTIAGNYQWDGTQTIDVTNAAALTVRRNASGGNILTVDTTNYQTIFGANAAGSTSIGTCTISNASPAVVTKASHGLSVGDRVFFTSTADVPKPLHPDDPLGFDGVWEYYYIISAGFTANSFEISLTPGGAAINTTTAGSGTHTLWKYTPNQQVFDSTNDALVEWRNYKASNGTSNTWTLGIRDSADEWFSYPGYSPRFVVDVTENSDYNPSVAFTAYIKAGINVSEAYGFWGGVYDTGGATGSTISGHNITGPAIGVLAYNYFAASNARTIANPIGGQFTNELNSNITGTTATGGQFSACVSGGGTYTNYIGVEVLGPAGGTVTNNYGVKVAASSVGTNNYGVWLQTNQNATFRAGTQAIWSSAASTLDFTSNTTYNFKIGANPSNGTAGTNYMTFTSARLAPVTTNTLDLGTSSLGWKTLYLDTSAVFNTTAPAQFRATTQSIYSSAASTLDLDTNTTGNLRVGGTVEYIWNASKFDFQANIADMTAGKAEMPAGTSLPASCVQGEYFQDTDSDDCANTGGGDGAICVCKTTNTWALVANI